MKPSDKPPSALRRIRGSFRYAVAGWVGGWRTQPNLRVHVIVSLLAITLGAACLATDQPLLAGEWIAIVLCIGIVISLELLNTAIEATVDLACPGQDPLAKLAKDAAAGAVLVVAITSVAVGLIVFLPRVIGWLGIS